MKKLIYLPLVISSIFLTNGCDFLESNPTKIGKFYNYEDSVKPISYKAKEQSRDITIDLALDNSYFEIIDGLDSNLFTTTDSGVKLTIIPEYNSPKDSNLDNIYEVKLYVVDRDNNDKIIYLKLEILKDSSSEDDNNSSNGDENNSTDGNTSISSDIDNDFIPNNIEQFLSKNPKNPDENSNNIKDGLEGDPLFEKQWYIRATGSETNPSEIPSIVGNDLNMLNVYKQYMGYNKGNPVILQIVDSGVDINHEDLKDNIDKTRLLNGSESGNPIPGGIFKPHGTMLAGIAAARAFNGVGIRGVAPFAKIAASNWLVRQSLDGLEAAWYSGNGANEIAVTNNSWGTYYTADTFYEDIMEQGANDLRDGKGRVYVFASGNARDYNADSNIQYVINNRFALVVSALEHNNKVANYSTPGANIWISAYGGSISYDKGPTIATTYLSGKSTITWESDSKGNYTYAMAGSSAAAPMVTASVALLLEACPNLGWRDVKYILAKSAKQIDSDNKSWVTNSAGLHFSRDYGFGLVNLKGAIDMCKSGYKNLPIQKSDKAKVDINQAINSAKSVNLSFGKSIKAEWVEVTVDLDSQNASDFDIYLTSPSGTKVLLLKNGTKIGENFIPIKNWMNGGFRFSTGAFLDENAVGNWQLEIINQKGTIATLKSVELKIYGY